MKKANIYKVLIKDKSAKEGKIQITCVAESLRDVISVATPTAWNPELTIYESIKYKESDILEIKLIESGVSVQDYISDYKPEEE
uniref:Uncharacterized protein n=1 Tax=Geladintestivirus 5 TaxID=3233137 RepID=A0AAU8MKZ3_9CAUD